MFKRIISFLICLALVFSSLAVASAVETSSENLITNSGFEDGTVSPWNLSGSSFSINEDTAYIKNGSKSAKIVTNKDIDTTLTANTGLITTDSITVNPGTVYLASVQQYPTVQGSTGIGFYVNGAGEQLQGASGFVKGSSNIWGERSFLWKAGEETSSVTVSYQPLKSVVYLDDFYFAPLKLKGVINGSDNITYGETKKYTALITNQLGGSMGVSGEGYIPTASLSLKEEYEGATFDSQTGDLTLSDNSSVSEIVLVGSATSPLKEQGVSDIVFEKTIKVAEFSDADFVPTEYVNLFGNSGFENGNLSPWNASLSLLSVNTDKAYIRNGDYSAYLITHKDHGAEANTGGMLSSNISVEPNKIYIASIWQYPILQESTGIGFSIDGGDKSGKYYSAPPFNKAPEKQWSERIFIWKANEGTSSIKLNYAAMKSLLYADETYFTELNLKPEITGASEIVVPESGEATYSFSANVTNSIGTTDGIEDTPKVKWYMKDEISGVSIDKNTGEITLTHEVVPQDIEIFCKATSYNSVFETTLSGIAKKTVSIIPVRSTASDIIIKAEIAGDNCNLNAEYTYTHPKNLEEQGSIFKWEICETENGSFTETGSAKALTVTKADNEKYIKFTVIPYSEDGVCGKEAVSNTVKIKDIFDKVPVLKEVTLKTDGKIGIGTKISVVPVYESELDYGEECLWYYDGETDSFSKTEKELVLKKTDSDKIIYAEIMPYTNLGNFRIYGDKKISTNKISGPVKPSVSDVKIFGSAIVGSMLTGKYEYSNSNSISEGVSQYKWLINGSVVGTQATYTVQTTDAGKQIIFAVTPVASDGSEGVEQISSAVSISSGSGSTTGFTGGGGSTGGSFVKPSEPDKKEENNESTIPEKTYFIDLENHWAKADIEKMVDMGIANGVGNNQFLPDEKITRAQLMAFVVRGLQLETVPYRNEIKDVSENSWYADIVQTAIENNIIDDSEAVRPEDLITREEMTKIIISAYELKNGIITEVTENKFSDKISEWAIPFVNKAYSKGLVNGIDENYFGAKESATRAQGVVMIKRLIETFWN